MLELMLLINIYALQYDIDPKLALSIATIESNFDVEAIGSKGELGLFQIMPSTYPSIAPKKLLEPSINIQMAMRHMAWTKRHCSHFKDNTWVVCYNLGVSKAKNIKYPHMFSYYKKVMAEYNKN